MSWESSDRKSRLPDDWDARRKVVLDRCGHRCESIMKSGKRCHDKATQVDHVIPGDDHSFENLAGICEWHHRRKSSAEGHAAQAARRAKRFHPQPPHPGSLPPKGDDENSHSNQKRSGQAKPVSAFEWRPPPQRDAEGEGTER